MVAGWLKMLVAGLFDLLLRSRTQPKMISASSASAPRTAPTTIPAICPPVNPRLDDDAASAPAVGDESLVGLTSPLVVSVVTIGDNDDDAITGNDTSSHRSSVFENTQHESVAFGEVDEQYKHSDPRFELKPQSSGSFSTAGIHAPLKESAGSAQFVKSARICVRASESAFPQMSLAVISCSLNAYSAHESAQRGREASLSRPQGSAEFCTIALQITLVVYRAYSAVVLSVFASSQPRSCWYL